MSYIQSWLSQTPSQLLALTALTCVLACALLQWRAMVRLRRQLQGDLAEVTSRLTMVAQATAGVPPEPKAVPVLQPATLVRAAPAQAPPAAPDFSSALGASLAAAADPAHGGTQDYATAQRLAARGAHPDAIVERCGLSAAEAHILVAMHEMKPAQR